QPRFPPFLRQRCQSMLAAQWMHRLPLIQAKSPANLASELILGILEQYPDTDDLTVVDFCSGGGGPTPVIEHAVNSSRATREQRPIPFLLSDISPHLDAWIDLSSRSENLSFIPQPVDATAPPPSVISVTATRGSKIFRLFSLSFHHFGDELAAKVLRSSLETSDGFAIIELQDRRVWSLGLMLIDMPLLMLVTLLWFWRDPMHLLFTYTIPILPCIMPWDGLVSCLRTREFHELVQLLEKSATDSAKDELHIRRTGNQSCEVIIGEVQWEIFGGRKMHTWPVGYMNWFVGRRIQR
ncbi:hypothetical protein NA57DRAFT_48810, partial [Rhizodiscina lignyota]